MNFFNLGLGIMNLLDGVTPLDSDASEAAKNLSVLAGEIFKYASYVLIPVMIVVGVAGIFYSIYLGVNLAKADSADKRQEAKSRMVNAIIGFVVIFVLVLLMYLFCANVNVLFGWTKTAKIASDAATETAIGLL